MQLERLHHVAIIVGDYAASKRFYTQILGLKVVHEVYREERHSYKLDLALQDGTILEVFTFPNAPARPSRPEARGARHLAFAVPNLMAWKTHLESHGVAVEDIRIDPITHKKYTFFADPDGLPLELYEN